ncbi:hypothetical protein ACP4OV_001908 [Aristida adscensionis]
MMTMSSSPTAGSGAPEPSTSSVTIAVEEVVGSHVLTVEGYTVIKRLAPGEFLRSSTFAAAGHRWSIVCYPNGNPPPDQYIPPEWILFTLHLDDLGDAPEVKAKYELSLLDLNGKPVLLLSSRWVHTFTCAGVSPSTGTRPRASVKHSALEKFFLRNDSFRVRCDITVWNQIDGEDATSTKFVVVPPPDMGRNLGHLLETGDGADIVFEVDGVTIPAHRSILTARSPVFKAQLLGPMKENAAVCVWIDDMEARVFRAMLHFVYTDSLPEIDEGEAVVMAQHLLVAADRFSLERLKLICEDKLCSYIDTTTFGTILALAEQHGCHGLKKACFRFAMSGSNLKAAMATDGFDHLTHSCPSVLKELLSKVVP